MKKILFIFALCFMGLTVYADDIIEVESNLNMANFWEKVGKPEQKVSDVGSRIINANKLNKRIPVVVTRKNSIINATSNMTDKTVTIYSGILLYLDNDDELAYILGHEMAHSLDAYDGPGKWISMKFNSKQYEYKADLIGVDLMVKAGYNPIAAITSINKFFPETYFDWGIFTTHPKSSKRMLEVYKYIYKKYPWYLETDMTKNVNYVNFTYSAQKEINQFKQSQIERTKKSVNEFL